MTGRTVRGALIRFGVAAGLVVAGPLHAAAQETVTVDEAVARGLQHSARLAELEARGAGAEAVARGRAAARLPVVAVLAGYTRTNHVDEFVIAAPGQPSRVLYPDVPDNYRARLDVHWPVYTAGRAEALARAAAAEQGAAGEDLEAARADVRLEITRAFWALVTAREREQVVERSAANLDVHVTDLRARLGQGLIPPNEVLTAEAQRSRRRVLAIEAANGRALAEADLRRLIGGSGPVVPATGPVPGSRPDPTAAPRNYLLEKDLVGVGTGPGRAERRALDQRRTAAREREAAAGALFRPQVAVAAGYDYARPNPRIFPRADRWTDAWDATVTLAWTLWDGGRRGAERAEASAASRAMDARLAEFDRQHAFELHARRLELESARAAIAAAEDGIRAADEALRVVRERYAAGVATSTDVLDAELALLQAQLDRTHSTSSARLAEARLARAEGR